MAQRTGRHVTGWLTRHRHELFIVATLLGCYAYVLPRWASWNENSRLDLVLAIVDDGTLRIDRYVANTGDYAVIDGRYYSDKAPGAAFLAVPVYAALRPVLRSTPVADWLQRLADRPAFRETLAAGGSGLLAEKIRFAIVLYVVAVTVVAVPSALLGVLLFRHLQTYGGRANRHVLGVLLYGLATPAFPFSGAFFGHQLTAVLLFAAFHVLFQIGRAVLPSAWAVLAGLLLGYAVITEYPSALIVAGLLAYAAGVLERRAWRAMVLALLPPLCVLGAYDLATTGTVLPVAYWYSERHTEFHSQGFLSFIGPNLAALWGVTFGSFRGLFFVSPVLLLAWPGFVNWWRDGRWRRELLLCLWAAASFLLFNASSVMWHGGFSVGPRYLVPMLPFLLPAVDAVVRTAESWRLRGVLGLGVWSGCVVWAETLGGQHFPDWTPNPLFNYSVPRLMAGDVARNLGMAVGLSGVSSLLPLLAFVGLCAAAWRGGGSGHAVADG